jgi:hypothetical protein
MFSRLGTAMSDAAIAESSLYCHQFDDQQMKGSALFLIAVFKFNQIATLFFIRTAIGVWHC